MSSIRDLKPDINDFFLDGIFDSTSLFQGEMAISIDKDSGTTVEYAEKCIAHYNALTENEKIMDDIQICLSKFMLYMYEEWKAMGIHDDIAEGVEPAIKGYEAGESLLKYLSKPRMYVEQAEGSGEIGYLIESECPWEPEHMCSIIIRGDELKYVGPSECNTPWDDDEDYYCIWNDDEAE